MNKKRLTMLLVIVTLLTCTGLYIGGYYNLVPQRFYNAEKFHIETLYSEVDYNKNGIDDYTDILLGARKDAENRPVYNGAYYDGGYPPDNIGVCTDVVWRAFRNAGYDLREMVNQDIMARPEAYPNIVKRDKNIDFRRVGNLCTFFDEYALSLTLDPTNIEEWQPGDIVSFENDKHVGIVSDKRNSKGQPYIIHNSGQPNREEDYFKRDKVSGHYRFDATMIPNDIIVNWVD